MHVYLFALIWLNLSGENTVEALTAASAVACAPVMQEFPKDSTSKEILRMANVENAYPRWLGDKILFQSNREGHWQVYVMKADGSSQRNISNDKANNNYVS